MVMQASMAPKRQIVEESLPPVYCVDGVANVHVYALNNRFRWNVGAVEEDIVSLFPQMIYRCVGEQTTIYLVFQKLKYQYKIKIYLSIYNMIYTITYS